MRSKTPMPTVMNALQIGTDSEGGYLVPDEYERTLVEALEEEKISSASLAKIIQTSSGDRKIPVVATKVPRPGSMRRAHSLRATTPSVRYPSGALQAGDHDQGIRGTVERQRL